jgi:hypothetical protein
VSRALDYDRGVHEEGAQEAAWPSGLREVFDRALTCEYASLTRAGSPVTVPSTPYVGDAGTLDVSTGLSYPAKAERARRNPEVALLFADAIGTGAGDEPVVLVQGHAAVRDADLQANTDRYARLSRRVSGKCVARNARNRRRHACKRTVTRGVVALAGHAGVNKIAFQGLIVRSKKLPLGNYTLLLGATNGAGQHSAVQSLRFTIVK